MHVAWVPLLEFTRLATREWLLPKPLSVDEAFRRVDAWRGAANAVGCRTGRGPSGVDATSAAGAGTGGNLVNDTQLAELAIETRCPIVSFDRASRVSAGSARAISPPAWLAFPWAADSR